MGQKVNPIGFRLGVVRGWTSKWYSEDNYAKWLHEDLRLKKFVKQKGSGGARHGDRKAPQFRGGGRAFGPTPRSHATELPKKIRQLALKSALSSKVKAGKVIILDEATASVDSDRLSRMKG